VLPVAGAIRYDRVTPDSQPSGYEGDFATHAVRNDPTNCTKSVLLKNPSRSAS